MLIKPVRSLSLSLSLSDNRIDFIHLSALTLLSWLTASFKHTHVH